MVLGGFLWLLSGALISFGLVAYFTGLVLVPVGVGLAVYADHSHRAFWPWLLSGLGVGPVVLLSGDIMSEQPPAGAVPIFWLGVALLALGTAIAIYVGLPRQQRTGDQAHR